jgi:hypothetical protein
LVGVLAHLCPLLPAGRGGWILQTSTLAREVRLFSKGKQTIPQDSVHIRTALYFFLTALVIRTTADNLKTPWSSSQGRRAIVC